MNGVINFLKPPGMSSNHAVGFFKRLLQFKKIGHAGTLDPGASGVLVILVGKATKLSDYLMSGKKTYIGEIAFGTKTDTQDAYGKTLETGGRIVTKAELESALPKFIGEIWQTPSKYSAIKVDGQRAYTRARQGEDFVIKPRTIVIESLKLLEQTDENRFLIEVICSKGTYIRALFEDIASSLNTVAYMSFLERTASGGMQVQNAVIMEEAQRFWESGALDRFLTPVELVLCDYPKAVVERADFKRISNGLDGRLMTEIESSENKLFRIYCDDCFFGLGSIKNGRARISTLLLGENAYEKHQV